MYLSFYGLKIKPFQNSTNSSFFWFGEKQREALAIFKYGISKLPGILLLTGDVGTGKTTLINVLLNSLSDQFLVVKVLDPGLEEIDFINHIAEALDFKKKFSSEENFLTDFNHFLETSSTLGKKVILVIDECQRLSSQLLDEIIKLANIEKEEKKSLKILLIGQDAFNDVLQTNKSKSLQQFITINYAITSLDLEETGEFIRHRLKLAGAERDIFSPGAISKIHEFSGGIPRRINILCDHALLLGFEQGRQTINGELIRASALDLRTPNFLHLAENDHPGAITRSGSIKIEKRPPEAQQKMVAHRQGKTFSMVILVIIPVFLITYFTAPTTYLEVLHPLYNKIVQFFINPHEPNTESRILNADDDIQKIANEDATTSDITTIPKTLVTKNNQVDTPSVQKLADVNIPPAGKLQQQDIVAEAPPETAGKILSQTDNLPVIDPIGTIIKDVTPDNEVPSPNIPHAEKEQSGAPNTPAVTENSMESEDLLGRKNEPQVDLTIAKEPHQKTQEVLDKSPLKPIDPGAVIDWILKDKSK